MNKVASPWKQNVKLLIIEKWNKEGKMGVQPESVWFCGVFTLKAVNEFKMVSGLCQQPHHQRVRLPVKSQRCNWPLITAGINARFLWPYIQWAYGLNVCHQTRNQICSTVGYTHTRPVKQSLQSSNWLVFSGKPVEGQSWVDRTKHWFPQRWPQMRHLWVWLWSTGSFRGTKISDMWGGGCL